MNFKKLQHLILICAREESLLFDILWEVKIEFPENTDLQNKEYIKRTIIDFFSEGKIEAYFGKWISHNPPRIYLDDLLILLKDDNLLWNTSDLNGFCLDFRITDVGLRILEWKK